MNFKPLAPAVIVSKSSFKSGQPYAIIASNISCLNALFTKRLRPEDIVPNALRRSSVDYYLAQVNNGRFSQFVYNSH